MVCAIGSREQHNVRALFSATHCFFWRRLLQTWGTFSVLSDQVGRLCLFHISTRLLTGPLYTTFGMASITVLRRTGLTHRRLKTLFSADAALRSSWCNPAKTGSESTW